MTVDFGVLVVDDEELYAQAIGTELSRQGLQSDLAFSASDALARCGTGRYKVILLDHRLPDDDGIRLIPQLLARQPGAVVIMMTAHHTIPNAVSAMRQGAEDYIVKETSLRPIIDRVLEMKRREEARAGTEGWQEHRNNGLLGGSAGVAAVIEQLDKAAMSPETTVLLTGETGVGKEVAARYLHNKSRSDTSPFMAVDCVALPSNLIESLLFGHEKGAFTGAEQSRAGAFEEAGMGTVLLDEIGDMGDVQGKLLRVLESRVFQRVGSMKEIPLRARIIAATNQDLKQLVDKGAFRQDLYQRLSVFPIHIPPLRGRVEDILLLAEHFRAFFAGKMNKDIAPLGDEVSQRLLGYSYPGNVRELKNIIERAVIMSDSGRIDPKHLPGRVLADPGRSEGMAPSIPFDFKPGVDTLESLEKRMIEHAMTQAGHVKTEAARLLGISRFQLLRRLERYGISGPAPGSDPHDA